MPQVLRCLNGEMQAVIRNAGKCDTTNDGNGVGKSTFLRQPAREIIMRTEKEKLCEVLVASLEDKSIRNISIGKSSTPESSARSGRPGMRR